MGMVKYSSLTFIVLKACVQAHRSDLRDGYHPQRPYVCTALGLSLGHRYSS
jgi:hypothetical protein